ncbi:hypothetical protein GGR54DRAFT_253642 [Hypoxylon sp. NC1633]|nr:hypothetical protein GGR54DRAFT_253642 [Hypoxylon sp. NC1633]
MALSRGVFCELLLFLHLGLNIAAPVTPSDGIVKPRAETDVEQQAELDVEKRNDQNSAIPATFDVSGWQDIAEEDCYIMLCDFGATRVWQRALTDTEPEQHYRDSGASLLPFRANNLSDRHTQQIDTTTTSAEEFPWRSIHWSGVRVGHLMPATARQQSSQGSGINTGYRRAQLNNGDWFIITFQNYDTSRVYCPALFRNPPDTSVCGKKRTTLFGHSNINPGDYDYLRVAGSNPVYFSHPR